MLRLKLKSQDNKVCKMRFREWEERQWCFNFALKNKKLQYCEDAMAILKRKYIKVSLKDSQKGDIISFHGGNNQVHHYAIISKTNGFINGTYVHSKWGRLRVVKGKLLEIPKSYGENILIWRKK